MHEVIAAFFAEHPECRLRALGARDNASALDLAPFGQAIDYLDAAASPTWVERYHVANRASFPGALALPGWVLVDLYLLPAAIGLLTCPARLCEARLEGLGGEDEAIAAAYYAAPSIVPGAVVGVSLISLRRGIGAASIIKALTLKMLRATTQRGIAQWSNASLRVHTRMGALRLLGPVPTAHGMAEESFHYAVDLTDEARWREAMVRPPTISEDPPPGAAWMKLADRRELRALLDRAASGERIEILPPGLSSDGARVLVRRGQPTWAP